MTDTVVSLKAEAKRDKLELKLQKEDLKEAKKEEKRIDAKEDGRVKNAEAKAVKEIADAKAASEKKIQEAKDMAATLVANDTKNMKLDAQVASAEKRNAVKFKIQMCKQNVKAPDGSEDEAAICLSIRNENQCMYAQYSRYCLASCGVCVLEGSGVGSKLQVSY